MTTMDEPAYILIPIKIIPPDIIEQYDLNNKVQDCMVLAKVIKGMYGLLQAGLCEYEQFKNHLALADYHNTG